MREVIHIAWDRFKIISSVIGDVQGRVFATLFYFTILMPFGLISRFTSDPLALKQTTSTPSWLARPALSEELDSARRQG